MKMNKRSYRNKIVKSALLFTTMFFFVFSTLVMPVDAETITSDKGQMNFTSDGEFLYLSYSGAWTNYPDETITVAINGMSAVNEMSGIKINAANDGDSSNFEVKNAWSQPIAGAQGTFTNSNKLEGWGYEAMTYEAKVPLSAYGVDSINNMTLGWNNQTTIVTVNAEPVDPEPVDPETVEPAPVDPEPVDPEPVDPEIVEPVDPEPVVPEPVDPEVVVPEEDKDEKPPVVTSNLTIDGYYSDWEQYPKNEITYYSNNAQANHIGQIAISGERLFVHFAMNDLYPTSMRFHYMDVIINEQLYNMHIQALDGNSNYGEGIHQQFGVYMNNDVSLDGQVAYTVFDATHSSSGKGDEIEFSIDLDLLAKYCGIPREELKTITIKNPNIGNEGISISGTSTGAILGVLIAAIIAVSVVGMRKKKEV